MENGAVVNLAQVADITQVKAALGWHVVDRKVDLDVSAILLDESASVVNTVFWMNHEAHGVKHSGDKVFVNEEAKLVNVNHEVFTLDLESIPARVHQILFVINIYTQGCNFDQVTNPYCRIITLQGDELCFYRVGHAGYDQGLIMARLVREPGNAAFLFQAMGVPCRGTMWKDSLPDVLRYAVMTPQDFEMGSVPPSVSCKWSTGKLMVMMISARGVRAADWNGFSDPYCICTVVGKPGSKVETKPRMNTLDPAWNETFQIIPYAPGDSLLFTLMDYDRFKSHDYLGSTVLASNQFLGMGFEGDLLLTDDGSQGSRLKITGSLKVRVTMP
jgi:stress response protein SCP2